MTTQRAMERKMLGITLQDHVPNQIIRGKNQNKRHCQICEHNEMEMGRARSQDDRQPMDHKNNKVATQIRKKI